MVKKTNPNILKKEKSKQKKTYISISIKISPKLSYWLNINSYSPTGIFLEASKELGYDEDKIELPEEKKEEIIEASIENETA